MLWQPVPKKLVFSYNYYLVSPRTPEGGQAAKVIGLLVFIRQVRLVGRVRQLRFLTPET